ncbi:MAG: DNA alkylation repair protein [Promethearchaeota archaeon]
MESECSYFWSDLEELCLKFEKPAENRQQAVIYLKTKKTFRGVPKAELRRFSHSFARSHKDWDINQVKDWIENIIHEADCLDKEFVAVYFLGAYNKKFDRKTWDWMWKKLLPICDDWSLTDAFVTDVTTHFLEIEPDTWGDLRSRVRSPNIWERRLAITAPIVGVRKKHPNWVPKACKTIELGIDDPEVFVQKAIAWTLRESCKSNPEEVTRFLERYAHQIQRKTLRDAIKNLSPQMQKKLLTLNSKLK